METRLSTTSTSTMSAGRAKRSPALLLPLLWLSLNAYSGSGEAQETHVPLPRGQAQQVLDSWDRDLEAVDALLAQGEAKKAYRTASKVIKKMVARLGSGPVAGRYLSKATVLKALAAYHLGEEDEAIWHWHAAHQIFPETANRTLSAYGEAGTFLESNPPREPSAEVPDVHYVGDPQHADDPMLSITKPRERRAPVPPTPPSKMSFTEPVTILMEMIIGADGKVRDPVVRDSKGEPTLVSLGLEYLRRWEYEPAELEGEKIPVYVTISMRFPAP